MIIDALLISFTSEKITLSYLLYEKEKTFKIHKTDFFCIYILKYINLNIYQLYEMLNVK